MNHEKLRSYFLKFCKKEKQPKTVYMPTAKVFRISTFQNVKEILIETDFYC